jgi:hypothetical protein
MSAELQAKFAELARAEAIVVDLRKQCLQVLSAALTRRNFVDVLREYYPFAVHGSELRVYHTGFDWKETDPVNLHRIDIHTSRTNSIVISEYVRRLWPHAVSPLMAFGCSFDLVSKTKFLAQSYAVVDGTREEDRVETGVQFLEYLLYHNVPADAYILQSRYEKAREQCPPTDLAPAARRAHWENIATTMFMTNKSDMRYAVDRWNSQYRGSMWCNLHDRLLELYLALAPLRLSPYELLWILDYIRPMNFRCYREGVPYDPNHTLKLRLFESVAESYRQIKIQ